MPYKTGSTYSAGQGVIGQDGIIYQATKNVPVGTPPPNIAYWLNVGQAVTTANGLAVRVQTAETKITSIEGVNTAQANQITGVQTALDGKAESSVVQSIGSRVTVAEGTLASHGTAITGLTNALPGKADASTVQALSNTVTQQGTDITAQGQVLTNVTASISNVGGENLLYNPSFEKLQEGSAATPDGWVFSVPGGVGWSSAPIASSLDPAGIAQRVNVSGLTASTYVDVTPAVTKRPSLSAGQVVTLSVYVRGTAGLGFQLFMQHRNAAGTVTATASQGVAVLADGWQRIVLTSAPLPAGTINTTPLLRVRPNVGATITAGFVELDRAQLEISGTVSGWKDNNGTTDAAVASGATATTALTARVAQTETGLTSASGQLTQLTNRIANAEGVNTAQSEAITQIDSKVTEIDGKATSTAAAFNALRASARDDSGSGAKADALKGWANTAAIVTEERVRSSNEEAAAERTTTIDAKVNQNAANVTLLESTVASNKEASAQQVAQVSAEVATNKAAIQQTTSALADTNGKLSTLWSVKMETTAGGQKYAASFGLGLQVDPSGVSSQFVVRADTFMLLNLNNGTPVSPFSVSGGQTFIASAFIEDGSITMLKIGQYLQSDNYVAGVQGWRLDKAGNLEFNGPAPGGGRLTMTNRAIKVYDANNVKRVQLGDLSV
ncbi:DUF1983 domain-containing protein [Pseudomonas veronii]